MKDPAFLFYSKDFYEGTRMMLPEERACYIDLLIYQHQNGTIPNDLKRVLMYCNGVALATLEATLEAKFEQTANGWENKRLNVEISARDNFKSSQSTSGKIGQFWKKAKQILSKTDFSKLRELALNKEEIIYFLEENETSTDTLQGLLKHRLNNNANANEDEIKDEDKNSEKEIIDYFHENCKRLPKIQIINQQRKKSINARVNDFGIEKVKEVIEKTGKSNFLSGENKNNWTADFDWIMKPTNFVKILEGNYNNKEQDNGKSSSNNTNNSFINRSGNTTVGTSGKKSASSILARQARKQASGNSDGGNFTIEAEMVE